MSSDDRRTDDGLDAFRGIAFGVFLGLLLWAPLIAWWLR